MDTLNNLLAAGDKDLNLSKIYSRELPKHTDVLSYKKLKNENRIDISADFESASNPITEYTKTTLSPMEKEYFEKNRFSFFPSLSSGVIKICRDHFVRYKVTDINTGAKSLCVDLEYYESLGTGVLAVCAGMSFIIIYDEEADEFSISGSDLKDLVYYFSLISPDVVFYEKNTRKSWDGVFDRLRRFQSEAEENLASFMFNLVNGFIRYNIKINYRLSLRRAVAKRETKSKVVTTTTTTPALPEKRQIIRAVGFYNLSSEKPPREVTEERTRTYKLASWNKRGYVRTYKTGKTTWVRETTCHRHGIDNPHSPANTTIYYEGKKG